MTSFLAARPRLDRSFERLYRRHATDVYRYAYGVLRNRADAEDVTQTTFLNAYRALERGEEPRTALNWLIAIAHNVCRQRFRTASRRPHEVAFDEAVAEALAAAADAPSAADVRRALGHLAFNQRAALVLREIEGRSYTEIADVLGISTSAVETLVFRARRALREQASSPVAGRPSGSGSPRRPRRSLSRPEPSVPAPGICATPSCRYRRGPWRLPACSRRARFPRRRHLSLQDVPSSLSPGAMPPAGPGGYSSVRRCSRETG